MTAPWIHDCLHSGSPGRGSSSLQSGLIGHFAFNDLRGTHPDFIPSQVWTRDALFAAPWLEPALLFHEFPEFWQPIQGGVAGLIFQPFLPSPWLLGEHFMTENPVFPVKQINHPVLLASLFEPVNHTLSPHQLQILPPPQHSWFSLDFWLPFVLGTEGGAAPIPGF